MENGSLIHKPKHRSSPIQRLRERWTNRKLCNKCRVILRGDSTPRYVLRLPALADSSFGEELVQELVQGSMKSSSDLGRLHVAEGALAGASFARLQTKHMSPSLQPGDELVMSFTESSDLLEDEARRGCPLCILCLSTYFMEDREEIRTLKDQLVEPGDEFCTMYWLWSAPQEAHLNFTTFSGLEDRSPKWLRLINTADFTDQEFFTKMDMAPRSAMESLQIASQWLESCTKTHASCWSQSSFLPDRLIYVGNAGLEAVHPRLCDSFPAGSNLRYMTLSHSWGTHVPSRLLKDNVDEFKTRIVLDKSSKTFQDAIEVVRYFGVEYLWIDTLCIIQDSHKDWLQQSSQMHEIYANSYCNIAATAAHDGSQSLIEHLHSQSRQYLLPLRVREGGRTRYVVDASVWAQGVEDAPLNKRAWVFQERMLSPRNLHFAAQQLFWECNISSGCEQFQKGFPRQIYQTTSKRINPTSDGVIIRELKGLPPDERLHAYTIWGSVVEMYTKGNLTRETDKLVAISGVAAKFKEIMKDEYLAGLWRKYLPCQLLWNTDAYSDDECQRPQAFKAPSWSWVSIIGPVENACNVHFSDEHDILVKVTNVAMAPPIVEGPRQEHHGTIYLQGRLAKMILLEDECESSMSYVVADCIIPVSVYCRLDISNTTSDSTTKALQHVFCLPVRVDESKIGCHEVQGLLLEPTSHGRGEFRCLGTFETTPGRSRLAKGLPGLQAIEAGCECFDMRAEESGLQHVKDKNGHFLYSIAII